MDLGLGQTGAGFALPTDFLFAHQTGEQVEPLFEQQVIVVQVKAEQRVTFGKAATPDNRLGPATGHGVQGGEALKCAHRIVGGQNRDGGAKADAAGASGDGGQHDFRGGDGKVGAVMFAKANEIDPGLIGHHGLVHHVAQHFIGAFEGAVGVLRNVAERVQTEFNRHEVPPGLVWVSLKGNPAGGKGAAVQGGCAGPPTGQASHSATLCFIVYSQRGSDFR